MFNKGFDKKKLFLILSLVHLGFYLILGSFPHIFAASRERPDSLFDPVVPFSADEINIDDAFQPPSWQFHNHFLGTDNLGRDVLAGIIYGCRTSLLVSLPAMSIAAIFGISLGLMGGYFGNSGIKFNYIGLFVYSLAALLGYYYGFYLSQFSIIEGFEQSSFAGIVQLTKSSTISVLFFIFAFLIKKIIEKVIKPVQNFNFPVDEIVLKLTELFSSIPRFILILSLAAFVKPSLGVLVLIIGFTSWTGMTRLIRGEILKIKNLQYIEAGKALGLTDKSILFKYILPNAIPSAIVAFTFGLANLLALEATLSFLGIGLPPDFISWGKIISSVRYNLSAWWLAVFPGIYLSLTVLALHNCSNYLLDKMNRR